VFDVTVLPAQEVSRDGAASYAVRLEEMDQFIIDGEARIGRLGFLIDVMVEYRQSTGAIEALIDLYEGRAPAPMERQSAQNDGAT